MDYQVLNLIVGVDKLILSPARTHRLSQGGIRQAADREQTVAGMDRKFNTTKCKS